MHIVQDSQDNQVAQEPQIKVDGMKRVDAGALKGICNVTFISKGGSLQILGCKIVEPREKSAFAGLPQKEYAYGGVKQYETLIELSGPMAKAFQAAVLGAWEVFTNAAA